MQMPKFHIIGYVVFLAGLALLMGIILAATLNTMAGQ
jgi:hypothetical protein